MISRIYTQPSTSLVLEFLGHAEGWPDHRHRRILGWAGGDRRGRYRRRDPRRVPAANLRTVRAAGRMTRPARVDDAVASESYSARDGEANPRGLIRAVPRPRGGRAGGSDNRPVASGFNPPLMFPNCHRRIIAFRNILIRGYTGVDHRLIYNLRPCLYNCGVFRETEPFHPSEPR